MAISCGYCGASHETVAEVRQCSTGAGAPPAATTAAVSSGPGEVVVVGPGPEQLARHAIVAVGGTVPRAWDGAPRVVVHSEVLTSRSDLARLGEILAAAAFERRRLVIEVPAELRWPNPEIGSPVAALGPRYEVLVERVHHLVTANAIDYRPSPEGSSVIGERAAALGGRAVAIGEPGDVVFPDGTRVWLDGGPIGVLEPIDGVPVLHTVALEHRSIVPPIDGAAEQTDADLAPDQRAAVVHRGGAARIIAPAGSGKTRVLTERARHLVRAWRLPSSAVTLVAFNKRAQEEMRHRTADLPGIEVRTLNSIGLAILLGTPPFARRPRAVRTIDEPEVRRLLGELVKFPRKRNADPVAPWIEALGQARLGLRPAEEVEAAYGGDVAGFVDVLPRYRAALGRAGAVDFDEQILGAIEVLLTDPVARRTAQRACRILLVDEFQDLTPAHLLLVRLLAAPGGAVFGVGDDDQTIYGYNGADPGWLIDFAELFPGAGDHPLEVNYRCPAEIVAAADNLLRHNRRRVTKTIRAHRPVSPDEGYEVIRDPDTVAATAGAVVAACERGHEPSQIAVLSRVTALLLPVQVALGEAGVAVAGGVGAEFMDRTAIRASLAWLRLARRVADPALGPFASDDLAEILRRPSRALHPRIGEWVAEQPDVGGLQKLAARLNEERDTDKVLALVSDLQRLARLVGKAATTADLFDVLFDEIGLGGAVATLDEQRRGMNRSSQGDDLTALRQLSRLQPDASQFESWLRDHLYRRRNADGVMLATVHRVKGQEWPVVVVHHAALDQYPHRLAEDVEEERRLFHVALTRAQRRAVVIAGGRPSPFIDELTDEPPDHTVERPMSRADNPIAPATKAPRRAADPDGDPLLDKSLVWAGPGVVLVDGGQDWTITSTDEQGAIAASGAATRRFRRGEKVVTSGRQRGALAIAGSGAVTPEAAVAFERLRVWRDRARQGKPAYVVFDDRTLAELARSGATSTLELARVRGVGPAKLEQYGDAVLLVLGEA